MGSILRSLSWDTISQRLDALDHALWERANDLGRRAGIGTYRNMWSNALLARSEGRPWSGVDYALVRAAIRVDEHERGRVMALRSQLYRAWERAQQCAWASAGPSHTVAPSRDDDWPNECAGDADLL